MTGAPKTVVMHPSASPLPSLGRASGCATFVRLFKPQFAPLVERGEKLQTVRPTPKRMPKTGDRISLRCWTGKPYRSKQRVLKYATISKVQTIWFNGVTILLDDPRAEKGLLSREVEEAFARADGFENLTEMSSWFESNHGLPFTGIVIYWQNAQAEARHRMPLPPAPGSTL